MEGETGQQQFALEQTQDRGSRPVECWGFRTACYAVSPTAKVSRKRFRQVRFGSCVTSNAGPNGDA